jgi:hypothetical protein
MSQHLEALERANRIRFARAQLKRDIKVRKVSAAEVLLSDIPDWLEKMAIEDLLRATVRLGTKKIQRFLYAVPCGPLQTVGELTVRQRSVLAEKVADWEDGCATGKRARPHLNSVSSIGRAA